MLFDIRSVPLNCVFFMVTIELIRIQYAKRLIPERAWMSTRQWRQKIVFYCSIVNFHIPYETVKNQKFEKKIVQNKQGGTMKYGTCLLGLGLNINMNEAVWVNSVCLNDAQSRSNLLSLFHYVDHVVYAAHTFDRIYLSFVSASKTYFFFTLNWVYDT